MSRFYITPESVKEDKIVLKGDELHHVKDVMRLDVGDEITAFDGAGREYSGKIIESSSRQLVIKIRNSVARDGAGGAEITLACGIPKLDRMDYIIQKTTELGVYSVAPLLTRRTVVELSNENKIRSRRARWEKIAIESSKQCGRARLPRVGAPVKIEEFLENMLGSMLGSAKEFDLKLIATLAQGTRNIKDVIRGSSARKVVVLIGPEGDFTKEEVDLAVKKGCLPVSFGDLVLRCDTAAIYAVSVLNYELFNKQ